MTVYLQTAQGRQEVPRHLVLAGIKGRKGGLRPGKREIIAGAAEFGVGGGFAPGRSLKPKVKKVKKVESKEKVPRQETIGQLFNMPEGKEPPSIDEAFGPRRVIAPAIKFRGEITIGESHLDAITASGKAAEIGKNLGDNIGSRRFQKGYIDNRGEFVEESEAAAIALDAGQIRPGPARQGVTHDLARGARTNVPGEAVMGIDLDLARKLLGKKGK